MSSRHLPLYLSARHPCSYLDGRQSTTLFSDPQQPMDMTVYGELLQFGFRRSGAMVYAPRCENCQQCVSVRVPVDDFRPRRIHRRVSNANNDLQMVARPARFDPEHYALYKRYTNARHQDGDMAGASPAAYSSFLCADWCSTQFLEFRLEESLVGVAVTDFVNGGLSAVYTFFDPDLPSRSLGTLAILRQIALCQTHRLRYLYLGYWVKDSQKMAYKINFRPIELWREAAWQRLDHGQPPPD